MPCAAEDLGYPLQNKCLDQCYVNYKSCKIVFQIIASFLQNNDGKIPAPQFQLEKYMFLIMSIPLLFLLICWYIINWSTLSIFNIKEISAHHSNVWIYDCFQSQEVQDPWLTIVHLLTTSTFLSGWMVTSLLLADISYYLLSWVDG